MSRLRPDLFYLSSRKKAKEKSLATIAMILKASFEISSLNSHVYNILKDVRLLNRKKAKDRKG